MDIKIKDFEGPLDLLLHLVSKYQMDIYEVPLIEVIEQYLAYLATLQAMKLEVAGEYMLMASQLTLIKSRRLLPKVAEEMAEAEDLEQDLLSQLEEYRTYKQTQDGIGLRRYGIASRSYNGGSFLGFLKTIDQEKRRIPSEPYDHCKG